MYVCNESSLLLHTPLFAPFTSTEHDDCDFRLCVYLSPGSKNVDAAAINYVGNKAERQEQKTLVER